MASAMTSAIRTSSSSVTTNGGPEQDRVAVDAVGVARARVERARRVRARPRRPPPSGARRAGTGAPGRHGRRRAPARPAGRGRGSRRPAGGRRAGRAGAPAAARPCVALASHEVLVAGGCAGPRGRRRHRPGACEYVNPWTKPAPGAVTVSKTDPLPPRTRTASSRRSRPWPRRAGRAGRPSDRGRTSVPSGRTRS